MATTLKQKTYKGVLWSGSEKFGTQAIQFVFGVFLARILSPADFGLIGMLTIFITLAQVFIDSGFHIGLIRKNDAKDEDFSTVFWFNFTFSFIVYGILFGLSPYIAAFYDQPILVDLTRVITINLIINSFGTIQRTILIKRIDFKSQAKVRLIALFVGGATGIVMALNGYGVWSLVGKNLTQQLFTNIGYWLVSSWRPTLIFSTRSFKEIFSFGYKLLISGIFTTISRNLYSVAIGKLFPVQSLGYYTRARQFKDLPVQSILGVSMSVLFPVLSRLQDDIQ